MTVNDLLPRGEPPTIESCWMDMIRIWHSGRVQYLPAGSFTAWIESRSQTPYNADLFWEPDYVPAPRHDELRFQNLDKIVSRIAPWITTAIGPSFFVKRDHYPARKWGGISIPANNFLAISLTQEFNNENAHILEAVCLHELMHVAQNYLTRQEHLELLDFIFKNDVVIPTPPAVYERYPQTEGYDWESWFEVEARAFEVVAIDWFLGKTPRRRPKEAGVRLFWDVWSGEIARRSYLHPQHPSRKSRRQNWRRYPAWKIRDGDPRIQTSPASLDILLIT